MHLLALHVTVLGLLGAATAAAHSRFEQLRTQDRQAGLTTLELTIITLGLFLIVGIVASVLLFLPVPTPAPGPLGF